MPNKPTVNPDDIRKLAGLARLHLTEEQCQDYTGQINRILDHVKTLETVDIEGVQPLSHVLGLTDVSREDVPIPSMDRTAALDNAPVSGPAADRSRATDGEFFLVPGVLRHDA
jgi:aspartyl-tRNA(Asn)/glutamyl-tRNA(Gln) amidotransferase subunit C